MISHQSQRWRPHELMRHIYRQKPNTELLPASVNFINVCKHIFLNKLYCLREEKSCNLLFYDLAQEQNVPRVT